jgi:hypothetical protein
MTMIEFNERKVIRNRNVVREVDRHSTRELRWSIFVGSLFAGLMCLYSWQQHRVVEYGYRIEALKKEQSQLDESRRKLLLDQATLENPARIFKLAEGLGLVTPMPTQVIFDSSSDAGIFQTPPALAWQAGLRRSTTAAIPVSTPSN